MLIVYFQIWKRAVLQSKRWLPGEWPRAWHRRPPCWAWPSWPASIPSSSSSSACSGLRPSQPRQWKSCCLESDKKCSIKIFLLVLAKKINLPWDQDSRHFLLPRFPEIIETFQHVLNIFPSCLYNCWVWNEFVVQFFQCF